MILWMPMSQHFQSAGEIVLQVTLKYLENENCTAPKQEQEGDESNNYSMLYDLVAIQSSEGRARLGLLHRRTS